MNIVARLLMLAALCMPIAAHAQQDNAARGLAIKALNGVANAPTLDLNSRVANGQTYIAAGPANLRAICQTRLLGSPLNSYSGAGAYQETTRLTCTTQGPISQLALFIPEAMGATGSGEQAGPNPVFYTATLEYGTPTTLPQFTVGGNSLIVSDPKGQGIVTDTMGVAIPAGATFYIRFATYIAWPPTASAAAATAGGALTAGTYYYRLSCQKGNSESGPSNEISGTTAGGNLSLTLTWAASGSTIGCDSYRIYRNTSSGSETFLDSVSGSRLSYVDTGALSTTALGTAGVTKYPISLYMQSGQSTTSLSCGASQTNSVQGTGALGVAGPKQCFIFTPAMILADDMTHQTVAGMGDSIQAGTGIPLVYYGLGTGYNVAGWFDAALIGLGKNEVNTSITGTVLNWIVTPATYGSAQRLRSLAYADAVVSDLCTNDIYAAGRTWTQCATDQITMGRSLTQKGKKYYITSLLPRVATTDNMLTLANQTPSATYESQRVGYNAWVFNGMQVSGGVPCNTAACGTPTPYIAGSFDLAGALGEVNSSGTPTQNGGYWPVAATATYTAQTLTGTPTSTALPVSTASYATHALAGYVARIDTGSGAGESCQILDSTPTQITCATALGIVPVAGNQFSIWQEPANNDGIHPSYSGHQTIASMFRAWVTANLPGL